MEVTDKNLCRICLYSQSKLYLITDTELQEIYEKLTDIKILTTDVHQYVCFLCYTVLRQCRKLKQQAIWSEKLLKENANASIEINHTFRLSKSNIMTVDIKPEFESGVSDVVIKREVEDIYTSDVETHTKNDSEANEKTDSEDDIPLKNISSKNKDVVGKRKERIINAKEIILSHEEQLQEMMERSKSENYTNSPYKCDLCYKGFIDPTAFDKHKEKHDKISGPYKCGICHLRYPSTKSLRAHTASTHSRSTYLTHMRKLHAGDHVCRQCGDSFYKRRGLMMHVSKSHRREQNNTEPPPNCVCKDCDIQFTNIDAYTRHLLITNKHTLFNDDPELPSATTSAVTPVRSRSPATVAPRPSPAASTSGSTVEATRAKDLTCARSVDTPLARNLH
ncbi:hypothetical protein KGM_204913 [Danaus plexippus plexippus]|uniref:Uncharacterized protein n=1 Tax=Danaus plexippus plexippus TaxID=278856 RepID=A0A212EJB3_DANPL|nr:hypothetical protein KGM_204913 [Danaus plexippus plexippus]